MAGEDLVELKFRLADGADIGPGKYSPATTVASKEKIPVQWPKDIKNCPKSIQDVKLIHAGKILENCRALAECRFQVGELPGGVTTMHVVLRLPLSNNNEKQQNDSPKKSSCLMRSADAYSTDAISFIFNAFLLYLWRLQFFNITCFRHVINSGGRRNIKRIFKKMWLALLKKLAFPLLLVKERAKNLIHCTKEELHH